MKISKDIRELICAILLCAGVFALLVVNAPAHAQPLPAITMITGTSNGGYNNFGKQAARLCSDKVTTNVLTSTGGPANLDALDQNVAHIAPMQLDTLKLASDGRDVSNLRVLFPMFPEAVLFITRANSGIKVGGTLGIGAKELVFNSIADLKGQTVLAAGGAVDTALYINNTAQIGYRVQPFPGDSKGALSAVAQGKAVAAVVTGAHPIKWIVSADPALKASLKILAIPANYMEVLTRVYGKTSVTYQGFTNGPLPIQTVTVKSVMVTQNYQKGDIVKSLQAFKSCVENGAEEYRATPGVEPAWRFITPGQTTAAFPMWQPSSK